MENKEAGTKRPTYFCFRDKQEYKKAGISIKVPKAVKEEIDKKTRDIFALTNRGIIATFTNLPEFINDIKNEYKK